MFKNSVKINLLCRVDPFLDMKPQLLAESSQAGCLSTTFNVAKISSKASRVFIACLLDQSTPRGPFYPGDLATTDAPESGQLYLLAQGPTLSFFRSIGWIGYWDTSSTFFELTARSETL